MWSALSLTNTVNLLFFFGLTFLTNASFASSPVCEVGGNNVVTKVTYTPTGACNEVVPYFGWTPGDSGLTRSSAVFTREPQFLPWNGSLPSYGGVVGTCYGKFLKDGVSFEHQFGSITAAVWCNCQIVGEVLRNDDFSCGLDKPTLTLTSVPQTPPDPRPAGTGGKSTLDLIAKVTENGNPKAGVAVTFKVEVKAGSGEHGVTGGAVHDHRVRKEKHSGEIKPLSGTTTASGEVRIKFEAPILAGTHTVTATCETCSNKTATKDVKVLVPDLVALTADTGTPKMFSLVGNTGDPGANHPDNHYFTPSAKLTLTEAVIPRLFNAGWGVVGVNDGSLKDGGLFDLEGQWNTAGGHAEHRKGTEVDIRTRDNSPKMIRKGYDALCDKEEVALGIQTLWHKKDGYGEHFHLYLSGIGLRADAIGGCCAQVIGPKKNKDGTPLLDKQGNPIRGPICE